MEDFEKEIIMKNMANKIAIDAAMGKSIYLGDPERLKRISTPPKNINAKDTSVHAASNPNPTPPSKQR